MDVRGRLIWSGLELDFFKTSLNNLSNGKNNLYSGRLMLNTYFWNIYFLLILGKQSQSRKPQGDR